MIILQKQTKEAKRMNGHEYTQRGKATNQTGPLPLPFLLCALCASVVKPLDGNHLGNHEFNHRDTEDTETDEEPRNTRKGIGIEDNEKL